MGKIDKRFKIPKKEHANILALRELGKSYAEIAKEYGVSRQGIFYLCKQYERKDNE